MKYFRAAALGAAFVMLFVAAAHAQNVTFTLSWTAPTQWSDGTALPSSSITGYEILSAPGCGADATTPLSTVATVTTNLRTHTLAPGSYRYAVRTLARWPDGTIVSSDLSAEFCAVLGATTPPPVEPPPAPPPPAPPNPPTDLKIVIEVVAGIPVAPVFGILSSNQRSSAVAGFAKVGRPCIGPVVFPYRNLAWRRVAPADVTFWKTTPTAAIAAPCG